MDDIYIRVYKAQRICLGSSFICIFMESKLIVMFERSVLSQSGLETEGLGAREMNGLCFRLPQVLFHVEL